MPAGRKPIDVEKVRQAVRMIGIGHTDKEVADAIGYTDRTIRAWRTRGKKFRAAVRAYRAMAWNRGNGILAEHVAKAAHKLVLILDSTNERNVLAAARAILEIGTQLRINMDWEERMKEVEKKLVEKDKALARAMDGAWPEDKPETNGTGEHM